MKKDVNYSFEQWCLDNNRKDLLDRWDYELNKFLPSEISYKSNKKYWFKCPKGIHDSQLQDVQYLPTGKSKDLYCKKCKSFAQYILDNYDQKYLDKLIEINQDFNLWEIASKSNSKKLNIICYKNSNHKYMQTCETFVKNGCGYCSHRYKPLLEDSLGYLYPETIEMWSDKNKDTPYDYYPNSSKKVWWKCKNDIHKDYERKIQTSVELNFRCAICSKDMLKRKNIINLEGCTFGLLKVVSLNEEMTDKTKQAYWNCLCRCGEIIVVRSSALKKGKTVTCGNRTKHRLKENNSNWKGGITPENQIARTNHNYKLWRNAVYKKDWYTCQCCGRYKKINKQAHHLIGFSDNMQLRYDVDNGITLCEECHYPTFKGSFHNLYGTINNTPEQLEEFINNKRQELNIALKFSIKEYKAGINILKPIKNTAS